MTHDAIFEGSNHARCWHLERENRGKMKMYVYAGGLVLHTENAVYILRELGRDKNTLTLYYIKGLLEVYSTYENIICSQ
jgi:hypothetical protein